MGAGGSWWDEAEFRRESMSVRTRAGFSVRMNVIQTSVRHSRASTQKVVISPVVQQAVFHDFKAADSSSA